MLSRGRRVRRRLGLSFMRLWVGSTFTSIGDGFALGAVPLLAVVVDPHPVAVSVVVASDNLPWLLAAIPAGAFADRFERGPVMALANIIRAFVILAAAILIVSGHMKLWLLVLIVLINAAGRATYYSSMQAMVPELVKSRELEHANGVLTATEAGTEHIAGPLVGTWLFAMSESLPFFAEAVTFVLSCFPFVRFRTKAPRQEGTRTSIWDGARLLWADRRLRFLFLLVASLAGLQGMEMGILVLLATTVWGISTGAYGLFLAVGAVGNLVGSVFADRLVKRFGSAQVLVGTAVTSGAAYLIMSWATSWHLAVPAVVLLCLAVGAGSVVASSLRQRLTPPDVMGRVGAAWRGITWGIAPAGAVLAGVLAAIANLRLPIALAGILQITFALVLARPLFRSVREGLEAAQTPEGGATGEGEGRRAATDDGSPGPAGLGPVS